MGGEGFPSRIHYKKESKKPAEAGFWYSFEAANAAPLPGYPFTFRCLCVKAFDSFLSNLANAIASDPSAFIAIGANSREGGFGAAIICPPVMI